MTQGSELSEHWFWYSNWSVFNLRKKTSTMHSKPHKCTTPVAENVSTMAHVLGYQEIYLLFRELLFSALQINVLPSYFVPFYTF